MILAILALIVTAIIYFALWCWQRYVETRDLLAIQRVQGLVPGPCTYYGWKSLWKLTPSHCFHVQEDDSGATVIVKRLIEGGSCLREQPHMIMECCRCNETIYRQSGEL